MYSNPLRDIIDFTFTNRTISISYDRDRRKTLYFATSVPMISREAFLPIDVVTRQLTILFRFTLK